MSVQRIAREISRKRRERQTAGFGSMPPWGTTTHPWVSYRIRYIAVDGSLIPAERVELDNTRAGR